MTIIWEKNKNKLKYIYQIIEPNINCNNIKICEKVFEKLYKYLNSEKKEHSDSIIMLYGNMFLLDSKNNISISELILCFQRLLITLANIFPVLIILGKCDYNKYNIEEPSIVSKIVDTLKIKNIYIFTETGDYKYQNILFRFTNIFDNVINKNNKEAIEISNNKYISENKVKLVSNHDENGGIVKYNIKNKKIENIKIKNDYRTVEILIEHNKYELPEKIPKYPSFKLISSNTNSEKLNKIVNKLLKKFPRINKESIQIINKDVYDYVKYNDIRSFIENEILEKEGDNIKKKILSLFKKDKYKINKNINNNGGTYKINKLIYSNMFSYEDDNVIDFVNTNKKIWCIKAPNGTGKSSIIDIIYYSIYGCTLRNSLKKIINNRSNFFHTIIEIEYQDEIYYIRRFGSVAKGENRNIATTTYFWKIKKNKEVINLTSSSKETDLLIIQYFGTKEIFYSNYILMFGENNLIVDMLPKQIKKYIEQIFDVEVIKSINDKANIKRRELSSIHKYLEKSLEINYSKKIEEEYLKIDEELKIYKIYCKITDIDGFRSKLIYEKIKLIEKESNKILKIWDPNTTLKIEISIQKNKIIINVENKKQKYSVASCSGFEKIILDIVIKLSIIKISNNSRCTLLMIDEVLEKFDKNNKAKINSLFTLLKKYYDTTIIITHTKKIEDQCDYILEINRNEDNYSYFENINNNRKNKILNMMEKNLSKITEKMIEDIDNDKLDISDNDGKEN